jgi:arsenate reductase (thioredoxin)
MASTESRFLFGSPAARWHVRAWTRSEVPGSLCVSGRSQMALGFFTHLAGDQAAAYSGGSEPADQINEVAVAAMAEKDIDITTQRPRRWTDTMVRSADVIISMGCGDTCPIYPGHRYETWDLPDPAGQPLDKVRPIRDEIEQHVRGLLAELDIRANHAPS